MTWLLIPLFSLMHSEAVPSWVADAYQQVPTSGGLGTGCDALLLVQDTHVSRDGDLVCTRTRVAYRILKTQGQSYGSLVLQSSLDGSIKDIRGWRLNEDGVLEEDLERDRIKKRAYNAYFHDDLFQVFADFKDIRLGDIAAFEFTIIEKPFFMDRIIRLGEEVDVVWKRVTVSGATLCKVLNDPSGAVETSGTTFTLENWLAPVSEDDQPPIRDLVPALGISFEDPERQSWAAFGAQYDRMTQSQSTLVDPMAEDLAELLSAEPEETFVQSVKQHVSNSVQYVDVEFGLGGVIPRSCDFVHEKRYGDCKDMSFYALSLLRAKGLPAFPVLARTRSMGKVFLGFVGDQFNHVVIAVALSNPDSPLINWRQGERSWCIMDLTDRYLPLPCIPSSLSSTHALLIRGDESELFTIPESRPDRHEKTIHIDSRLDLNGTLQVTYQESGTGRYQARSRMWDEQTPARERREHKRRELENWIPGAVLQEIDFILRDEVAESLMAFTLPDFPISLNDKWLIVPNLVDLHRSPFRQRKRTIPLLLGPPRQQVLVSKMTLPPELTIVSTPQDGSWETPAFSGQIQVSRNGQTITLKKTTQWRQRTVNAEDYVAFRKAYRAFLKAAKAPISVLRPTVD